MGVSRRFESLLVRDHQHRSRSSSRALGSGSLMAGSR